MVLTRLELLPLSAFVLLPGTFIITYVIAVLLGHVEAEFPYISDTGTRPPESCIFSQLLNVCSLLLLGTVYVRYKEVEQYYRDHLSHESPWVLRTNRVALWLGCVAASGVSLVANFQETEALAVHACGAFLALGVGTVYTWVHTLMSFRMQPLVNGLAVARIRLALSSVATVAFLSAAVTAGLSLTRFHGKDRTEWRPEDGGYKLHVASTASEWLLALAVDLYLLTFVRELHGLYLQSPKVHFVADGVPPSTSGEGFRAEDRLEIPPSQPAAEAYFVAATRGAVH